MSYSNSKARSDGPSLAELIRLTTSMREQDSITLDGLWDASQGEQPLNHITIDSELVKVTESHWDSDGKLHLTVERGHEES